MAAARASNIARIGVAAAAWRRQKSESEIARRKGISNKRSMAARRIGKRS